MIQEVSRNRKVSKSWVKGKLFRGPLELAGQKGF